MITREQFYELDIYKKIDKINQLLKEGYSLTSLSKALSISRKTITKWFADVEYVYNKESNSYIKDSDRAYEIINREKIHNSNKYNNKVREYNTNANVFANATMKENFIWMMNNFDILQDIINERLQGDYNKNTTDVIEVKNVGFVIDLPQVEGKDNAYQTTIRLNKKIWEEFNDLYKEKYSTLNKYDVISVAFQEFIEKYKNK